MSRKINSIRCACGRVHEEIPDDARESNHGDEFDGWFFECACKSTLFVPVAWVKEERHGFAQAQAA